MVWEQSRRGWGSRITGASRREWVACQGPAWREGGMAPRLAQHKVRMAYKYSTLFSFPVLWNPSLPSLNDVLKRNTLGLSKETGGLLS
jgi:hypothetical protein